MIGIGHKQTKIKILEGVPEYLRKHDDLIAQGLDPQQVASILQKEEYEQTHRDPVVEEPYKLTRIISNKML